MKNKSVIKNDENKTQNKEIKNLKKDKVKNNSLFNKNNRSNKEESKYSKDKNFPKEEWSEETKGNYTNLKETLNSNEERYMKLAQFTLDVVGTLQDEKLTVDKLAQYNVPELKQAIEGYFRIYKEFCPEGEKTDSEICDLGLGMPLVESEEILNTSLIQNAYRTVGGEMTQIGDYSVIYYLNNLDFENGENR